MKYFAEITNYTFKKCMVNQTITIDDGINFKFVGDTYYVQITESVYNKINESIPTNMIFFDNTKLEDLVLTINDLEIHAINPMTRAKIEAQKKLSDMAQFKNNILFQLAYVRFFLLNAELINKGYFITDSNRDQKYAEIISSTDIDLKQNFIDYLEVMDFMDNYMNIFKEIFHALVDIDTASTIDEIDAAVLSVFPTQPN